MACSEPEPEGLHGLEERCSCSKNQSARIQDPPDAHDCCVTNVSLGHVSFAAAGPMDNQQDLQLITFEISSLS